jgi:hypothetical protein
MAVSDIKLETFNIGVFEQGKNFAYQTGRRLNVTASKRLKGMTKELRIVGAGWNHNDPSSLHITVQPAALRVYPRIPNGLNDFVNDMLDKALTADKWTQTPATGGGAPTPPVVDPWTAPKFEPRNPSESDVIKSPLTRVNALDNRYLNSLAGNGPDAPNQFTGRIWGSDKFGAYKDISKGNMMTDSSTTIPHAGQSRFWGLAWSAQFLKDPNRSRDTPLPVEVFRTRKFVAFPTWSYTPVGNPGGPYTDENWGLAEQGGLVGELSSETISSALLGEDGPGPLTHERLAVGMFFRGTGEDEKVVIYFHQLQAFNIGQTQIRSKGFAFERKIDQTTGVLTGDWVATPYPFDVPGSDKTYYPETMQVESYGPERSVVTCITPASYWKDNDMPVDYPLIINNTYWTKLQMGKFAIENATITKNYRTGQVEKKDGIGIGVFNTYEDTDERWTEKYQLLNYKGELWATNMTYTSYYAGTKAEDGTDAYMRFTIKTNVDRDGKPVEWHVVAGQYGYYSGGYYGTTWYYNVTSSLVGIGEYVFSGSARDYPLPEGYYSSVIAGKVGVVVGKVLYGIVPDDVSTTFIEVNSASGRTNPPKEFFPDFYDYILSSKDSGPELGGQSTWGKLPTGQVIPIWNGTADNSLANEALHGISSLKGLNVDNWIVIPAASNSYLWENSSGGTGQWRWLGL